MKIVLALDYAYLYGTGSLEITHAWNDIQGSRSYLKSNDGPSIVSRL
jgi:hypothetical protein